MIRVALVMPSLCVRRDFRGRPWLGDAGAIQAAAVLREAGHEVTVVDSLAMPGASGVIHRGDVATLGASIEAIIAAVPSTDVLVVANHVGSEEARDPLLEALRAAHPTTPILLADLDVTGDVDVEQTANASVPAAVDGYLRGEADVDLSALITELAKGRPTSKLERIGARIPSLDNLPLPAWDAIDLEAYWSLHETAQRELGVAQSESRTLPIVSSRAHGSRRVSADVLERAAKDLATRGAHHLVVLGELSADRVDVVSMERVIALGASSEHQLSLSVPLTIGASGETERDVNRTLEVAMALHEAGAFPTIDLAQNVPLTIANLDQFKWTFDRRIEAGQGPKKVILNATYRCNNRCTFCATGTRTQFDGNFQRQKEILVKYRKVGVEMLDIDGGEPTLNPNLLPLVRFARRIGYSKVNVTTNGRMASYETYAHDLASSGVTSVLFSIHGPNAQIHAQNVGVAEAFDQTCEGVRQILKAAPPGLELGANVTITKSNVHHLPALAELVWDLGLRWWNIQFLTPFGRATRSVSPDTQEAANVVMPLLDRYRDKMKLQIINLPFCFMPGYEEFMVGDLLKLERHMIFVNNDEVNLFDYLRERRVKKEVCETCPRAVFCGGFYELDNVPEPTWLISAEDLVRPVASDIPVASHSHE